MEKIAIEYGDGLFDLALEEGCSKEIRDEARVLRTLLRDEPDYTRLLTSKNVDRKEKDLLLKQAFEGKVHPFLLNFLRLMSDRNYFAYVPSCFSRYEERYDLENNVKKVTVRSAGPLKETELQRIRDAVERKLGGKAEIDHVVDPSLVAGLRIEAPGILIENSAKSRLEDLKRHLGSAVTENN